MNKRQNKKGIFDDKRIALVVAFVLGILCWIIIAGFVNPSSTKPIYNVNIDYVKKEEDYKKNDLIIVTDRSNLSLADVMLNGDASEIGSFTNTDVTVYPDYSAVNGPGTYVIPLKAEKVTSGNYNINEWTVKNSEHSLKRNPTNTISLTFETVKTKSFPVTVEADGITAAEGYFRNVPEVSQAEVTVSGPSSEIAKVGAVIARYEEEEERQESIIFNASLVIVDVDGEEMDSNNLELSPVDIVEVTIPVLEMRTLNLTVDITGTQQSFDKDWLMDRIELSTDKIQVVGVSSAFTNLSDPYPLTEFDISELGLKWKSSEIEIKLPEGLTNRDSVKQVTASLNPSGLLEKTFEVTNIKVSNKPKGTTIEPSVESVTVTLVGDEEQINKLLPEKITVEVDAFDITATGNESRVIPARILIPSTNKVFASGEYTVICDIEVN